MIILLSNSAATSLFVYNEVLFADWLGKPFVVVMAANAWEKLRPNMQAILGSCPAVDFENRAYEESMDILLYHLKPFRNMPAVILEQEFLDRMVEGLKPLRTLAVLPGKYIEFKNKILDAGVKPQHFFLTSFSYVKILPRKGEPGCIAVASALLSERTSVEARSTSSLMMGSC